MTESSIVRNGRRAVRKTKRTLYYFVQKLTHHGYDRSLETTLRSRGDEYLASLAHGARLSDPPPSMLLEDLPLDGSGFALIAMDKYRRFRAEEGGPTIDAFGRQGTWVGRSSKMFFDRGESSYLKIFDEWSATKGESRFLQEALEQGVYDFLCPGLSYLVHDAAGLLRGYAILKGRPTTPFEFERYLAELRGVIFEVTRRTGFYFNDLAPHNVILHSPGLSLIDLESVLPVSWFGEDLEFSRLHLDEVDIGWPIQSKWHSPDWYRRFLVELKNEQKAIRGERKDQGEGRDHGQR